jgi:hypothetical protein
MEATQKQLQKYTTSMGIGTKDQQQTRTQGRKYITEVGRIRHLDVLQWVYEGYILASEPLLKIPGRQAALWMCFKFNYLRIS